MDLKATAIRFATPEKVVFEPQTKKEAGSSLRRMYTLARLAIGVLGILLPAVLIFGEKKIFGSLDSRQALSDYYHTGVRDYFVATLVVIAALLLLYKFFEQNLDNTLSIGAAIFALGLAFFPKGAPAGRETALQLEWGEACVARVHHTSTLLLFVCLGALSILFALREHQRRHQARLKPSYRLVFHLFCAAAVIGAALFMAAHWMFDFDFFGKRDILVGETVAIVAFGLSFIYKGAERDLLIPSMAPDEKFAPAPSTHTSPLSIP